MVVGAGTATAFKAPPLTVPMPAPAAPTVAAVAMTSIRLDMTATTARTLRMPTNFANIYPAPHGLRVHDRASN